MVAFGFTVDIDEPENKEGALVTRHWYLEYCTFKIAHHTVVPVPGTRAKACSQVAWLLTFITNVQV